MGRKPVECWKNDDLPASAISVDGKLQLCAAIITQAWRDLHESDPVVAVDALSWWLVEGPIWCDALGYPSDEEKVFEEVLR